MKTLSCFVTGLLAAASLLSTNAMAQQSCPALEAMVDAALPSEVGSTSAMSTLLAPPTTGRLSQSFQPTRAQGAVGDSSLKPESSCPSYAPLSSTGEPFHCVYNGSGSKMRVELARGRIAYLSDARSQSASPTTLSEAYAKSLASQVAATVGIPTGELSVTEAQVNALRLASLDNVTGEKSSYRAELHVRYPRRVGGVLVPDSNYHVAVDSRGQVARMHIRWPDFQLAPGLSVTTTRTRAAVLGQLVAEISAHNTCGSVAAVKATLSYLPVRLLDQGGGRDEENLSTGQVSEDLYAPGLLVGVVPAAPTDPDEVQPAGEQLLVPLLGDAAL